MDYAGSDRSLTKAALGVLLGYILAIVLLNIPGLLIRTIVLIASAISFIFAGYYRWVARSVEVEKRRTGIAVYAFFGLIALLVAIISWSLPLTTPVQPAATIGLLAGGVLGFVIIFFVFR